MKEPKSPIRLVIAGGGTSGWLAAAAFSKLLKGQVTVTLVESEQIGRIGVGEATIPPMREFNKLLGIDEQDFMRSINATFKLGIEFQHWGQLNEAYIHSFGTTGKGCWACDFHNFWLAGKEKGLAGEFGEYCLELQAAKQGRMLGSDQYGINYAYHLDAGLYAGYLKAIALKNGATHTLGNIDHVAVSETTGNIETLYLKEGFIVEGDFFLDCTGFAARLIEGALNVQYEPYGHYLPCDSAVAVQTEPSGPPRPYTQAIAHESGWQWRIPLQNRVGNGLVYSSRYLNKDDAHRLLEEGLESKAITDYRHFNYKTGRRLKAWENNCVAIGLAGGFLEPVESTSIHLAMSTILRLLRLFPAGDQSELLIKQFNEESQREMEQIRDFIIMHYKVTARTDSAFWRYCKAMAVPDTLAHRLALFEQTGVFPIVEKELFKIDSWAQVMIGQGLLPKAHHPIVNLMSDDELKSFFSAIKMQVDKNVDKMPSHQAFIDHYCGA